MEYRIEGLNILILAIFVVFLGEFVTRRVRFLRVANIPAPVTGGIICSTAVAIISGVLDAEIIMDMQIRDLLLLIFFATIGLNAKLPVVKTGGIALAKLTVIAVVLLVLQNLTGVFIMRLIGEPPVLGLFGGSISFAGGYGTTIAWSEVARDAGIQGAEGLGIACATFGLIAGGLIGGPIGKQIIVRNKLSGCQSQDTSKPESNSETYTSTSLRDTLGTVLILALCVEIGDIVNQVLVNRDFMLPGFLTAMFTGIVITNVSDVIGKPLKQPAVDQWNDVSLQLFLGMSLMSMQLNSLVGQGRLILLIVFAQVLLITLFAMWVVFRSMSRDYDAAVITAGFAGLGLGATPVGIANMNALTEEFGPSPKAFLVVPLMGAFFIDIANALIIRWFVEQPWLMGGG